MDCVQVGMACGGEEMPPQLLPLLGPVSQGRGQPEPILSAPWLAHLALASCLPFQGPARPAGTGLLMVPGATGRGPAQQGLGPLMVPGATGRGPAQQGLGLLMVSGATGRGAPRGPPTPHHRAALSLLVSWLHQE